jgi:hypothetical protein
MFWTKTDNKLERGKILNSFPKTLSQDVNKVIEILPLNEHNVLLTGGQIHNVESLIHSNEHLVMLDKELLKIPSRLYFNEPSLDKEKSLTSLQRVILNCIYLRHHNGFVRQRRLEQLVEQTEYFIIPFTFQLLGEYVIEILEVLQKHINPTTIDNYLNFINENPKYWRQTESRMISYWDVYYRRPMYPKYLPPKYATRQDYVGQKIIDQLKKSKAATI